MLKILVFILIFGYLNAENSGFTALFGDLKSNISFVKLKTFEGDIVILNETLTYYTNFTSLNNESNSLKCRSSYHKVGILVNWTDIVLFPLSTENSKIEFTLTLLSKRLGGSDIICSIHAQINSTIIYEERIAKLIVSRHTTVAELIFRIVVSIFVIFLTFVMGCGLDRGIVINYFKTPISPFIGFCSQFVFMPLISAALGKFSQIEKPFALGLLVIGCSPGGGASNIWTVLFGGDLNLSMTMTFISSCAALAMMPLWLFILGRLFIDPKMVVIPYGNIAINLLQVVIPVGVGIFVRWKWEKQAKILVKKVKIMGLIFLVFILTFGTYANLYIYKLIGDYIYLLPIGAFLPWLGFFFGFILSVITRRNKKQAIAIALETGFQNIGIAILILKFSMPQPNGDMGSVMPLIVALFTPLPLYFGYIVLLIKKKCFDKSDKLKNIKSNSINENQKDNLLLEESPQE